MPQALKAEHGVVCALGRDHYGYFGWPSVGRLGDGTLAAVSSGLRNSHVDPYGRTVFFLSRDDGRTWSSPRVINDSPLDDRDAGVVGLDGRRLLVSWFTSDTRKYAATAKERGATGTSRLYEPGLRWSDDAVVSRFIGSWVMASDDGGETWDRPIRVPLTTPHGPIRLKSGELLYFGKEYGEGMKEFSDGTGRIRAMRSADGGENWTDLGVVPLPEGTTEQHYSEPHVVELTAGKLIGHIRFQFADNDLAKSGLVSFSIFQSESTDGGLTWSMATPLGFHGSPPHLLWHSSGVLVCVYGHRLSPYGERAALSHDEGQTWERFVLRDDAPDGDLGYPSSIELSDGSFFTLYYQKPALAEEKCALLYSRWRLP